MQPFNIRTCECGKRFISKGDIQCKKCRPVDFTKAQKRSEWHKAYIKHRNKDVEEYRKKQRERQRANYETNKNKRRRKGREYGRLYYRRIRSEMFDAYGRVCTCCGETIIEFLTLEHLNGTGRLHRIMVRNAVLLDLKRRGWPKDGFTILCFNCNKAKYLCQGVCPHQRQILNLVNATPVMPIQLKL